jgi:hypothetical protein
MVAITPDGHFKFLHLWPENAGLSMGWMNQTSHGNFHLFKLYSQFVDLMSAGHSSYTYGHTSEQGFARLETLCSSGDRGTCSLCSW